MDLIRTKTLSDAQYSDINKLCADCNQHDKTKLSFPIEDQTVYFLLYDEDVLLSALSAFSDENDSVECSAFTRPSHRQQGYFSSLLQEMEEEADEKDIIFTVDPSCGDSVKVMEALEAELWYEEYMMELELSSLSSSPFLSSFSSSDSKVTLSPEQWDNQNENKNLNNKSENKNSKYIFKRNGIPVGSCQLSFRDSQIYFYHFEILPELRGKGLGTECFKLMLFKLYELRKNGTVLLQVSSDNMAAMALYQRAGFYITESLAYYLY
jgi:ribosomal protein S18 acetylase RimI-like enzyme